MDAIRTKADFYRLYEAGALGNKPRTWNRVEEVLGSGYGGTVTVRCRVPSYQGMKRHRVPVGELAGVVEALKRESGLGSGGFAFNESLPDERLVMQGEVVRGSGGLCLSWSVDRGLVMREAMLRARHSDGVSALVLLRWAMDAASLENLEALLDRWDGHVVEFASYETPVGELGWNTVFFEVRRY